jgi:hypothetical protein
MRLLLLILILLGSQVLNANKDSTKVVKMPKHFIRPAFSWSLYATGERAAIGNRPVLNSRLGDYRYLQSVWSFYTPLYTKATFSADSTSLNTFHLLAKFNSVIDRPEFSGLSEQHRLYKTGVGLRAIAGLGKKLVLFADATPMIFGDASDRANTRVLRLGATLAANFLVNPGLSFRFGVTRSFLFGNKNFLPMIGMRIGKLDGLVYLNIQLPRTVSLHIQPTEKFAFSIYSRTQGGLYNFSNKDSIYLGNDDVIQFGQTGIANGIRFDFRPGPNFNFFASGGFAVRNRIWFYSYTYNRANDLRPLAPFYEAKPQGTIFVHVGLTWRFGKSKNAQGNYLMYEIYDMNNSSDPSDNNTMPGNGDIRRSAKAKEMHKVKLEDVGDLIQEADLY